MAKRIFLAHGNEVRTEAKNLAAELEKRGAKVFLDSNLASGERWADAVENAIREANAYVILVRKDEEPSEHLRLEWRKAAKHAALHPERKIIPVVLDGLPGPTFLRVWNAVPMTGGAKETSARILGILDEPGYNEAPIDSPEMRPLVESWRRRLEGVERSARAMTSEVQELESVE